MRSILSLTILYSSAFIHHAHATPSPPRSLVPRADFKDPTSFEWIKNYTALGDSFAAGIGAGNVLKGDGDEACSRYDAAYPSMMQTSAFGGVPKFTNLACTGDKSSKVAEQIKKLEDGSQNLVTLSAGGNDAILSEVLKACVFLPSTQDKCDEKIKETQQVIDTELQGNIDDLLQALSPKLSFGGLVLYTLYAQYFNADTDACSDQTWNKLEEVVPGGGGIKLTKRLRKRLNELVLDANTKIRGAIASQSGSSRPATMNIKAVDWDQAVKDDQGRFCEEGSKADPKDPSNIGLMFQRHNTDPTFIPPDRLKALKARENELTAHNLEKRIPDATARVFHPTVLGHEVIAAYSLMAILETRIKDFKGERPKACFVPPMNDSPDPKCDMDRVSGLPSKLFLLNTFSKFCDAVEKDATKELNWIVGPDGNEKPRLRSKRSPPVDPDSYNDYEITLSWTGGEDACAKGCKEAYNAMGVSPCGHTGGFQNIMACSASAAKTNCGKGSFEYKIKPPAGSDASCDAKQDDPKDKDKPKKPQPGPVVCREYKKEEVDKCGFKDIHKGTLNDALEAFRIGQPSTQKVKEMQNYTQVYGRNQNPTYMLNIGYIPGCEDFETQVVDNPQGKSGDNPYQSISYAMIIRNTYEKCGNNHGLGGYQDYGCLRYGFYPTKIKGVFSDTTPKHYDYYWNAKNKWCGD